MQQDSNNPDATIWTRWNAVEGRECEILLPNNREVGDMVLRLAEAIETLASFEGRNHSEILTALQGKGSSAIRLRKRGQSGSVADGLVRLWGLDIFGLSGLNRTTIIELRFAAVMQSVILLFGFVLWSSLFVMLLGLRLIPLALALGMMLAVSEAFFRRQLFTVGSGVQKVRRILGVVMHMAVTILTTMCIIPPVTLIVFRVPIESKMAQERAAWPQSDVSSGDFFYKTKVLGILLRQDDEAGKTLRAAYFMTVSVVVATNLIMPVAWLFLRPEVLEKYYSSLDKAGKSNDLTAAETGTPARLGRDKF